MIFNTFRIIKCRRLVWTVNIVKIIEEALYVHLNYEIDVVLASDK